VCCAHVCVSQLTLAEQSWRGYGFMTVMMVWRVRGSLVGACGSCHMNLPTVCAELVPFCVCVVLSNEEDGRWVCSS
jgi:hypothetical protein